MSKSDFKSGFEDSFQQPFFFPEIETLAVELMERYKRRCAISGADFCAQPLEPTLFFLQPLNHGGPISAQNAVLVERASANLLQAGILLISDDYEAYVARKDMLAEPVRAGITQTRPLHLPDTVDFWPSRAMIAYHRSLFRTQ